jgi:dienelactone hydrolase
MAECTYDWQAWIDFARAAGYQRIGLWGHSLGATKSIYYMATQHDPRVTCVVAGSPPRFSYEAFVALRVPLLIMVGTAEAQTMMAFQGLPPRLAKLAAELDHLTFASIPGADHAYTHQRDYVWNVVQQWLEKGAAHG